MFEITADDIAALNDTDLRTLVGLLCESEAKSHGFPTSLVTWSGHQDASDGGLDVRVALPTNAEIDGFVPRPAAGFQVKKTDMPRKKILAEMCPNGVLRPVIRDLADRSGAYIIVSSEAFTSDDPLQARRAAMKEAVKDLPNADAIALDFYDRGRLATWVRYHAGLIMWVREKIGKPIHGWSSYGAWTYDPDGVRGEYLLDDAVRVLANDERKEGGLPAEEGIQRIRDWLLKPHALVRLVGLSGLGKTRLVQALFDDRVGEDSLDPALACYTNIADEPDPHPITLASELIIAGKRAILIVDNCPPDLHGRLSQICRSPESLVSLITIEYDVREDQPEGTEVFSLEPLSIDLIDKLVRRRIAGLSPVDARTIAEFSGGNARIAVALAGRIGKDERIAGLSDEDLFKRLFQQRNEPNESLLLDAQALALVYSFEGEDLSDGVQAELFRLGALVGRSSNEMFRSAVELQHRDLIQRRGVWRAVLPHAIANRLASIALQNIPFLEIERRLINGAPERLLKSFSRRLRYLNTSKEAHSIVSKWLRPGGMLEDVPNLSDLGYAIFDNVAPVAPEEALLALQRVLLKPEDSEAPEKCRRYVELLRSLAYDPAVFERCLELIMIIADAADAHGDRDTVEKAFTSLFPICYSGTHATIEMRLSFIQSLLLSGDLKRRTLGLKALKATLQASHFGPGYNFEFGALSRDYGYWPRTRDDVKHWFESALKFAENVACSNQPLASEVRKVIAEQFRGLWTMAHMYEDLEHTCQVISVQQFWLEGWLAVRQTIHYDGKGFTPEVSARIASLEQSLHPADLVQRVRSIVLSENVIYAGLDSSDDGGDDIGKTMLRVEAAAYDLGRAVAMDEKAFSELLPDLVAGNSQQLWSFGRALADGAEDAVAIWGRLVAQLNVTPTNGAQVFRGFLNGLNAKEPALVRRLMDGAVKNALGTRYPLLQTAIGIDTDGVNRLIDSLVVGQAPIGMYQCLQMGGATNDIAGQDFNRLLLAIAAKPGGLDIAFDILSMRLSFARSQSTEAEIIDVGCDLMRQLKFANRNNHMENYNLGIIGRNCLIGDRGATTAQEICRNLKVAIFRSETYAFYQTDLLEVLIGAQPIAALETLCEGSTEEFKLGMQILDQAGQLQRNAFDAIPEDDLLRWCDQQPEIRYPAVALGVTAFRPSGEAGRLQWTSTALKLLDKAPDRVAVLKKLVQQFAPVAWISSQAMIVESNAKLLDDLEAYPDAAVVEFARSERTRLSAAIESAKDVETFIDRQRDERFE